MNIRTVLILRLMRLLPRMDNLTLSDGCLLHMNVHGMKRPLQLHLCTAISLFSSGAVQTDTHGIKGRVHLQLRIMISLFYSGGTEQTDHAHGKKRHL